MNKDPRIISLAPTQTEIIAALGGFELLAGVTENCDYPEAAGELPAFGSWYAPDLLGVIDARPDLVCTFGKHQEEMRAALAEAGLQVYHSDPPTVRDSLATFREIAALMNRPEAGVALIEGLKERLERVSGAMEGLAWNDRPLVFRIMHWDPLITVGPGAFQHDVIELAGGCNVMANGSSPYFVCDPAHVRARNPHAIFLCEPHIRKLLEEDAEWRKVSAVRSGRIFIFDCGLTCRSGPRIVDMVEGLARAIHPERAKHLPGEQAEHRRGCSGTCATR